MDDNELYPIGDVARRTGLSVSAIRFYADAGIVAPAARTGARYRLYDVQAIARLEFVRTLRELGASLEDIRQLLAGETTLRDLAAAHLALVERQALRLRARRAVLRTIVKQHTPAEQVSLMHKLVSMSDDDRDRLIDEFWYEISDGLDVHPAFVDRLRSMRPNLPAEPTTEQLEAWIELADLVQDDAFRHSVREYLHDTYSTAQGRLMTTPPVPDSIEKGATIMRDAQAAYQAGLPADSPQAQDIARRYVASLVELTGRQDTTEFRRQVAANLLVAKDLHRQALQRRAAHIAARFTDTHGRYLSLVATINGATREDNVSVPVPYEWMATALNAPGCRSEPSTGLHP
ncbi:MerR family transcriptional regulator [Streptantibioticus rubrisoli]|uniref:MerR family transcriptional regulator n=1 Tax=Streptantibioticus rubrisoli TaxID=1387313 RepID=A0ABT1PEV2_9ACTN|nr:MerR family transcriptional regulator [Streptantibioticus rubrisoli]MCQ4043321.1 MerR family transcriptional regulator [Streptantibioticus rubrisoli]